MICLGKGKLEDIGYFCLFSRQLQLWKHDLWRKSSWQTTPFCTKLIFSLVILTGVSKIFSPNTQKVWSSFLQYRIIPKHASKHLKSSIFIQYQWNHIFFFSKTLWVKIHITISTFTSIYPCGICLVCVSHFLVSIPCRRILKCN